MKDFLERLKRDELLSPGQAAASESLPDTTRPLDLCRLWMAQNLCTEQEALVQLGAWYQIEVVSSVPELWLDSALVQELPVDWARRERLLPLRNEAGVLLALTDDPHPRSALDDLGLVLQEDPRPVLCGLAELDRCIHQCYAQGGDSSQSFISGLSTTEQNVTAQENTNPDLLSSDESAPAARLVNLILLEAVQAGASDIHFEPFSGHLRVRSRIDGLLYDQSEPPRQLQAALISRLKVMGGLDIAEKRLPQDGTARLRAGTSEIDVRISTMPVSGGERVVLRLLNRAEVGRPLGELGLPDELLHGFQRVLTEPWGALWVSGPTGSGKTTTLYAALRELDTGHGNVLTIEDPVEYQLDGIGQISVQPRIGLTFARGLRHILRQDPDVILVGETRDAETAEIAVRASLTGHLVFSTLHTNDAAGVPERLIDMGIEPLLLATALKGCLAQRLVRTLCPACRTQSLYQPENEDYPSGLTRLLQGHQVGKAVGCDACRAGYSGRTGLYEWLPARPRITDAVRIGAGADELRRLMHEEGLSSLWQDGATKTLQGLTTPREVLRCLGRTGLFVT